ncbi:ATP-dependent Clp protease ATP-binding subunit [Paenarthrobacter sp. Z7-10]|uniref:ATP-dependent Clp protease ATP-binding subunit n=1 Tax=Paenarthrobacter sp. Z7-10 TaxID=2787635 RepID=UPI0022A93A43|nr:ATP-dependent Clp protease ATP-binding subunit [Paenarthrobacter sp. Z7-10]MCZ2404085.1 ATP-dependent Clp protease ATP-binding subunit [Paenarthrobacter sp. Z7-10]
MPTFFNPAGSGSGSFDEFLARYLQGQRAAQTRRPIDITRLLSRGTHEVLGMAAESAAQHGHSELDALHILRALLEQEAIAAHIRRAGADPAAISAAAEQRLPEQRLPGQRLPEQNLSEQQDQRAHSAPSLTSSAQRALFDAYQVARAFGSTYVDPEHLFYAFVLNQEMPADQVLATAGITPQSLQDSDSGTDQTGATQTDAHQSGATQSGATATPMLDKFGTDLTSLARAGVLDPVIGRSAEIEQTIEILARRTKNNPVLVGEAGVGKTAIVAGLAQAIVADDVPEQLRGKRVISLDLPAMLAGTRYRGDFEERLTQTLDEIAANADGFIVFIDELHTIVGAGGSGEGGMDAGNILKPRLAQGVLHLVGATTLKEYRTVEKDPALERRFQPVRVGEPGIEDAVRILTGLKDRYEEHHGVRYTDAAIRAAVELSARYIADRFLPDKAIDLIDQAGARLSLRRGPQPDSAGLRTELESLEQAKNEAVAAEQYEEASRLRDQISTVNAQLAAGAEPVNAEVGEAEIAGVVARATGIPAARLTEGDRERLARLEEELRRRVIGQDDAVGLIAKAVRRNRTGMGDAGRPVGSFLFLGPTGVGKTELAKALAESLFGDETAMVRFDMSEFGERHTVSRLVGAPPGYVGYDEAGQLTERVRRNPYTVVLLDEVEKAHPDVFNLLLQVLDDGRLTDGQGRTVDFRNTVILMTSNLGSEFLASRGTPLGFGAGDAVGDGKALRNRVMGRLRETMRPEFLNRIDEIVLFRKLEAEQLQAIARLQLRKTEARLASQDIGLEITEDAVACIADHGYEPEYGARPLRRVIQRELDDRIAELLVSAELQSGGRVAVSVEDGELRVTSAIEARLAA